MFLLLTGCQNDPAGDPFLISSGQVGKLRRSHTLAQLDSVYQADSLVRDTTRTQLGNAGRIEVYEKGGKHLLTLSPTGDSLGRIGNIRVHDKRFATDRDIHLGSTFGEIKEQYEIRKIITSLNNVLVLFKGTDVYVTISKESLPASLRYSQDPIEAVQIPDTAPVKYLMVGWD
ncbi:hypothetical protein [Robiginitalea sp. PM2]|uniref:hypothetical protein n=1 Tax=Robiginitalea TaxID=252306 RepID=UPI0011D16CDF|nr:hypothetical protein [Robiginitalea sp. PM2]MDC6355455.1 hypothetical protein [Robiginitalea sp. PM2]MDC6375935.1 hypothetical protein [Robiginitalea sp. SP8]